MKAIIKINPTALEHFPDEDFSKVQVGKRKVSIDKEVELSEAEYTTLTKASYNHPENGLPCKYFIINVINLADNTPLNQLSESIKAHTNLYAAIYLTLVNTDQLKDTSFNFEHASSQIYQNLQQTLQKQEEEDHE